MIFFKFFLNIKVQDIKSGANFYENTSNHLIYIYPVLLNSIDSDNELKNFDSYTGYSKYIEPNYPEHFKKLSLYVYLKLPFCLKFTSCCAVLWFIMFIVMVKLLVFNTEQDTPFFDSLNLTMVNQSDLIAMNKTDQAMEAFINSPR